MGKNSIKNHMARLRFVFAIASIFVWSACIQLSFYSGQGAPCPEILAFISASDIYFRDMDRELTVNATRHPAEDTAYSWSPDGKLLVFESDRDGNHDIYLMDFSGEQSVNLTHNTFHNSSPVWSPTGTQIAFVTDRDGDFEVYVMNADGSNIFNVTQHSSSERTPAWSEDGTRLAFSSLRTGFNEFFEVNVDGSNLRQLNYEEYLEYFGSRSQKSDLAFESDLESPFTEIYIRDASGNTHRLTYNNGHDFQPDWSPRGDRIAFVSAPAGPPDIFLVNADGSNLRQITNSNLVLDFAPQWRPCS